MSPASRSRVEFRVGLVVLVFVLLVVMPGLLYLAGWGVNHYIQKAIGRDKPAAPPNASSDGPSSET